MTVDVVLDTVDLWVQLHELPKGYSSSRILEQIGNFLGTFVKYDDRFDNAPWKMYHCIRVSLAVDKPLKRRMNFIKRDKTSCWVMFKYERFHTYCYFCGILGHAYQFCRGARDSKMPVEEYLYGPELRAGGSRGPRPVGAAGFCRRAGMPWGGNRQLIGRLWGGLRKNEKRGGNPHPNNLLRGFGEAIEDCGLAQLPMVGYPYTWEKGKGTANWMEERLNKVLVTDEWRGMVMGAKVMNLRTRKSDHSALFLGIQDSAGGVGPRRKGFRFEMTWLHDEGCRNVVEQSWQEGRGQGLQNCIQYCGTRLTRWGGDRYHKYGKRINELTREQQRLRGRTDPASLAEFQHLELLSCTEAQEDAYWRQRVKQHWLKEADANTKFFHSIIIVFSVLEPRELGRIFFEGIVPRITQAQNESLLRSFELDEVKSALFAMFPDKKTPEIVTDLRPIALSNVVYRIMAKMLANRMKPLMEVVISESQSAFIPDRLITDNILLAAEVGHFLNRKQCGVGGWSALKLDMAKVNGLRCDPVIPTRGIRQGDPLSPYLFIICAEGLSLLLQQAHNVGSIHGCKAKAEEATEVKRCLAVYENLSGQAVNYHKSSICYSRNTSNEDRQSVAQILGVAQAPNFGKYLGLPSFIRRHKKAVFAYVEDKIRQRIGSLNKKLLSQAGKEILLKTVAQFMPTFSMSVFLLPVSVCTAVERTMNRYWWDSGTDRRIHWQAWRMLTKPDSLVARVYKARYFPKGSFFDAQVRNNPSFCWRSIMAAKSIICGGVRRRIGNGESTFIWTHPWLRNDHDPMIQTEVPIQLKEAKVAGLIDQQTGVWDPSILTDLFQPNDVAEIMKIPISPEYDNTWYWHGDPRGEYSVKSGYKQVMENYQQTNERVDVDPRCAMCGLSQEDTMHALVLCDFARNIWNKSNLTILNIVTNIFYVWFDELLNVLDSDGIFYAVAILYNVWRARNRAVWEATLPRPEVVLKIAAAAKLAWNRAHPQPTAQATTLPAMPNPLQGSANLHAPNSLAAKPPGPPRRICRVDGGYMQETGQAALGVLLLDTDGGYVSAYSGPLQGCSSPLMAEELACKEALSWLKDRGEQNVEVYTDCLTLHRYLTTPTVVLRTYLGYAIDTCRLIASSFQSCSFHFIPRLENHLAHALATTAYQQTATMYWDLLPPDVISAYF
ncbi:PREDICTED: uncharacterized protein LOC109181212 [Ipomoea nil]|uniref:uncharacterized protein LOC109181212 n=1 Tax=Ipomoea nil TaxID=35883 RepID=UPI000901526D|nr:PREDICTED: uncharacterized protein LOC109181212 [Ipomoea nil]